jgi:hypothetical protein
MIKAIIQWLVFQIPGIILGFFGLFATGYVNEMFTKRAENRKSKEELLEKFSDILIEAEENMWQNDPIREKDFIRYCRRLSQYNFKLADELQFNYYILWVGVWSDWIRPRKEWTAEETEMHDSSIKDLKEMNIRLLNFAYPDRNFLRNLEYKKWQIKFKLKYLFRWNKDKKWNNLVKQGRDAVRNILSNPFS